MQALMLAAGMGKRLSKYTSNNTKCMVEVAGRKLIDRAIEAVKNAGISKFVIVVGYKGDNLIDYINENYKGVLDFVFIKNEDYATTNNIYSFYLAKNELIKDDTILLESDLIYDEKLLNDIVEYPKDNVVTVAKYESWMDGTCVHLTEKNTIKKFIDKEYINFKDPEKNYKTVNIYKFKKEFVAKVYLPFLETYMNIQGLGTYYEAPLKYICQLPNLCLDAYIIGDRPWYEIDDAQDLDIANVLFSSQEQRYDLLMKKYGGYWRYNKYIDFCYLVNPYFPTKKMLEKLEHEFPVLLTQYPSGESVQNMNAERLFNVDREHILVGNGAAELINALGRVITGKIAVNFPAFNEYIRCFRTQEINLIDNTQTDFRLDINNIKKAISNNDWTFIVSPDNPSGFMLLQSEIVEICDFALANGRHIVIDESFADFAELEKRFTLFDDLFLRKYPNVVVVKSISKSYGVPGLRLGLLATYNTSLYASLLSELSVWNINSFAEYFLQTLQLFIGDYNKACDLICAERKFLIDELSKIDKIKIYPSQANYIMIDLKNESSRKFCIKALEEKRLIIKDLSSKDGFKNKNFIRIAVRDRKDNEKNLSFFKTFFK